MIATCLFKKGSHGCRKICLNPNILSRAGKNLISVIAVKSWDPGGLIDAVLGRDVPLNNQNVYPYLYENVEKGCSNVRQNLRSLNLNPHF